MAPRPAKFSEVLRWFLFIVINLTLLSLPPPVRGMGAGAVAGIVHDKSGATVVGAKVLLTEKSKGLIHASETDNSGSFLFPSVLADLYTLNVTKPGFRSYQVDDLMVEVGEAVSLSVTLTLGDLRTVVSVSAPSSTALDSESNTLGSRVDSGRVRDLPLNGREFLQLGLLAGGADDISPANNLTTANVGPPAREIVLPGTFPNSTGYSLNGFKLIISM